ncbi:MAG: NAD(P)H-dependent oxidoreductase [Terracidiphilus sp.]|jgi:multimeric flavodoxin WrbA
MRFTILNGEPDPASTFQKYLDAFARQLTTSGHAVTALDLRELDLKGCSGCFGCWVKTPGECAKRDDSAKICRAVLEADLLIFASPLVMGFTTSLLKRAADQLVPLIHPFFVVEGGEVHHRARYARYPKFGLLLGTGDDSDAEDIDITTGIWTRTARNLKSRMVFNAVANRSAEEVADEIALVA